MAGGYVDVNSDGLQRIAQTLKDGVAQLDGPANAAPDAPDAGQSTGLLAGHLAELVSSVAAMARAMEQVAEIVTTSGGAYHDTDVDNANRLPRPR